MKRIIIIVFTLFIPCLLIAQTSKLDSIWRPVKFFEGNWHGESTIEGVGGKYARSYQFIYNSKFLEVKNKSTYQPTEKNPKGEVHEDLGYISYDKKRKTFVLRQFHIEGFVNQYVLDSIAPDGKTLRFTSESIENIPSGWKARETYEIINDAEFIETFELAAPGHAFEVYSKVKLQKQ